MDIQGITPRPRRRPASKTGGLVPPSKMPGAVPKAANARPLIQPQTGINGQPKQAAVPRKLSNTASQKQPKLVAQSKAATAKPQAAEPATAPKQSATKASKPRRFRLWPARKSNARKGRKRLSKKQVVLRSALAVILIGVLTASSLMWLAYANVRKSLHGTRSLTPALSNKKVTPDLLKGEGDGRINVLLMGVGGPGHDGADLTDTLVVFSIDPVNNKATMLSVPRDVWVKMPVNYFGSVQKINAAYESGKYKTLGKVDPAMDNEQAVEAGLASIDQVMKEMLDVTINYHVLVNFQAFRQAIDTVGGITVNVPERLYDPTMAWENKWNPVLADAGVQQMDGVKALMYARSRETSSDFARGERQRQILLALKDKVLSAGTLSNPIKISELMNTFGSNVYTDLSVQGASRLYGIMKKIDNTHISSLSLVDPPHKLITTDHVGTTSVDRPVAGFFEYADIQAFVHSQLPDGYLIKEKAPVAVLGPTADTASAVASTLTNYGYTVAGSGALTQPANAVTVVDLSKGKAPFTRNYLVKRYGVKAVTALPAGVTVPSFTDAAGKPLQPKFVIIVTK